MKALALLMLLTPLGFYGCNDCPPLDAKIETTARQQRSFDMWTVDQHEQGAIRSGIITQRTIYTYQFDPGSARLTELGNRDLAILADYYRITPGGTLTLVRGDASNDLYAARTAAVKNAPKTAGVDPEKVAIADGLPNGVGISGQYIVNSVQSDKGQFTGSSTDSGSLTNQGVTSGSNSSTKGNSQ